MDWEIDPKYLRPFQYRLWNRAVKDRDAFLFLMDYFSETVYWHTVFPTIATDVVLTGMVKKYKELKDISKLDIYLCFPYLEYHTEAQLEPSIKKLAEVLFDNNKEYVTRLVKECRLLILNSNTNTGEQIIRMKAKHIDMICDSQKEQVYLPIAYIVAVSNVQNGLNNMLGQLEQNKRQLRTTKGNGKSRQRKRNSPSQKFNENVEEEKQGNIESNLPQTPQADSPKSVIEEPILYIHREPEPESSTPANQKPVDIARIHEIIKEQAEQHNALMNLDLNASGVTNPVPGKVTSNQVGQLNPSNSSNEPPKRSLSTDQEQIDKEKPSYTKPEEPSQPIAVKPILGTVPTQPKQQQHLPKLKTSTVAVVKKPQPRTPVIINKVNHPRRFIGTGQDVMPGINAPYSVRMTGGRTAIMQPNPRVKEVMRQKVYEDQRLAEEALLKPYGCGTLVPVRVLRNVPKTKMLPKANIRHHPYNAQTKPLITANQRKIVLAQRKTETKLVEHVAKQNGNSTAQTSAQNTSPVFHTVLTPPDSSKLQNVYIRKIEATRMNPHTRTVAYTKEPTVKQVALATMTSFIRSQSFDRRTPTLLPAQSGLNTLYNNIPNNFSKHIHPNPYQKPNGIEKPMQQVRPVEDLGVNNEIFNFNPIDIIDHEEIVTTSADELYDLLEQTEREEMANQNQLQYDEEMSNLTQLDHEQIIISQNEIQYQSEIADQHQLQYDGEMINLNQGQYEKKVASQNLIQYGNKIVDQDQLQYGNKIVMQNQLLNGDRMANKNQLQNGNLTVKKNQKQYEKEIVIQDRMQYGNRIVTQNQLQYGYTIVNNNQTQYDNKMANGNQMQYFNKVVIQNQTRNGYKIVNQDQMQYGNRMANKKHVQYEKEIVNQDRMQYGNKIVTQNQLKYNITIVNKNQMQYGNKITNENQMQYEKKVANQNLMQYGNKIVNQGQMQYDNRIVVQNQLQYANNNINKNQMQFGNKIVNNYNNQLQYGKGIVNQRQMQVEWKVANQEHMQNEEIHDDQVVEYAENYDPIVLNQMPEMLDPDYDPDDYEEGTVHLEEIPDDGQIEFEEPRGDDPLYSADEVERILTPRVEPKHYNITAEEMAMLEYEIPDLFKAPNLSDETRFMMAAFVLGRQENPNPNGSRLIIIKLNEQITMRQPKQITELYVELDFGTNEWKRFQKIFTYKPEGVFKVVDYLDGPQNRVEVMLRNYPEHF